MEIEVFIECINNFLKVERSYYNKESNTEFIYKEEETEIEDTSLKDKYICYNLKLLFNNKKVYGEGFYAKKGELEEVRKKHRDLFIENLIPFLIYSEGPYDWMTFIDGTYSGVLDNDVCEFLRARNAKMHKNRPQIYRKPGYILNPNDNIVNNILKRIELCDGLCPCYNEAKDKHCPCSDYRENGECHCGLYIKEDK